MDTTRTQLGRMHTRTLAVQDSMLAIVEGPHQGRSFALEREHVLIGRDEWCDLTLDRDSHVSSKHCECWVEPQGILVRDLGSRNGVFLNGVRIKEGYFTEGHTLSVGDTRLVLQSRSQKREIPLHAMDRSERLVGIAPAMRKLFAMMERVARRNVNLLLRGETGTGKTSVAQAIHEQSQRKKGPFVVVNCGSLPAGVIEGQLFGYEKGAFTGATSRHHGFFAQAQGGTLFLDEIAELPLELQPKLLDVLERRKVRRIGSESEQEIDFRLISATHRNLAARVQKGRFRQDLFFRLSVVELEVPPLRERQEDLPLLIPVLLELSNPEQHLRISAEALEAMQEYVWPGNVRELRNVLERAITFLDGDLIEQEDLDIPRTEVLSQDQLPSESTMKSAETSGGYLLPALPASLQKEPIELKTVLAEMEKAIALKALQETEFAVPKAAYLLGITPTWLYNRMRKYNIQRPS